ncbi:MAG: hypothetical protein H7833_09415 [Magnetococcus sp. DMHC-1]|nr:hypothetical protein [Magnetococcales bacterium]
MNSLQSSAKGLRSAPRSRILGKPLARPIDPEDAERLLSAQGSGPDRFASTMGGSQDNNEVHETLRGFLGNAKRERLECMVPIIETLQVALALDRAKGGAPPGTLTVKGWLALLNSWEKQLQSMQPRQLLFGKSFVQEAVDKVTLEKSPLVPIMRELMHMMETVKDQVVAA